jgi:hypothetical protein
MSNRKYYEIPGNTKKYSAKNMKYQEILENSWKYYSDRKKKYSSSFSIWLRSPLPLLVSVVIVKRCKFLFLARKRDSGDV